MATRKRVRAFCTAPRRAPDGSAFTKCDDCGVSVAVALMDMHECKVKKNEKKDVKRFKADNLKPSIPQIVWDSDQPRSSFVFFMESYSKTCKGKTLVEINSEAIEKWRSMTFQEKWPYFQQAQQVDKAYMKLLHKEEIQHFQKKDDEADSAKSAKGYQFDGYYNDSEDSDCDEFF